MELDGFEVIKHGQQVGLDGVGVTGLTQDLQQGRVRHKEESREEESLLLQVPKEKHSLYNQQYFTNFTIILYKYTEKNCNRKF